jgi:hypothetical protein
MMHKRPNKKTIETDVTDTILELRLPNTHARFQITGAAIVLWNTWKQHSNLETGVAAVIKKYQVSETQAKADAEKLYADLEAAGLLE